ncbi:MAG: hypothetical protein HOL28_09840 [Crocinitomicaceae bacterium]|jgi:hypothetical protein|nr:hypothetical protein [Crocinitomicaceae bacterium]
MKNRYTLSFALLLASLMPAIVHASKIIHEKSVHIKGHVVNEYDNVKHFKMNVYHNSKLLVSQYATDGKFEYKIPLDIDVVLEFEAINHYTKRIALSAIKLRDALVEAPTLVLTVQMFSLINYHELKSIQDIMDFPSAFIWLDRNGNYFDLNKKQMDIVNNEIDEVLHAAVASS